LVEIFLKTGIHDESYWLSDIAPSKTYNRSDRSPGFLLCHVLEQYAPTIGYLKERRKDLTICCILRQHKAIADVLQFINDDDNGNSSLFFTEGEARPSLRSELNAITERAMRRLYVQQERAHSTFGISTGNLTDHDSMVA
jgi:hypothetical protein